MADLPDDLERLQNIAVNLRHRLAKIDARIHRLLERAQNRCKLTECQGKSRCKKCVAMNLNAPALPAPARELGRPLTTVWDGETPGVTTDGGLCNCRDRCTGACCLKPARAVGIPLKEKDRG